ncbi:MAG: serine hydroxymethyltransferase [Candidatus Beckwithbacteria bacterium]
MDQVFKIIAREKKRQREELQLIPSENFASKQVMEAVGSCLMNKYAEGYPKKRYYQGNTNADQIEALCQQRALKAFGLSKAKWGVNVQPHSGCEANLGVYNGLLKPGDKIMSMFLPDGGHLSHGWPVTLVAKIFKVQFYHVSKQTKVFDYDLISKQALKFKPKLIISGGTAYPREIDYQRMGQIAKKAGAYYLADIAHEAGLVAAGAQESPFPVADVVTFTTHKTFRGPRGAMIIARKELMDKINFSVFPGLQGGPHLHTIAGIAVALQEMMTLEYKQYAFQVVKNAQALAKTLKQGGLEIVSGGTDKHLVLIDLRNLNLSGWVVAWALEKAGIIVNRNTVPYDTGSPYYPSGLRLGTPALTSRGMKEGEMKQIAKWIFRVIDWVKTERLPEEKSARDKFVKQFRARIQADKQLKAIKQEVAQWAKKYPLPGV